MIGLLGLTFGQQHPLSVSVPEETITPLPPSGIKLLRVYDNICPEGLGAWEALQVTLEVAFEIVFTRLRGTQSSCLLFLYPHNQELELS